MNHPASLLFTDIKEDYNWISPALCGELYKLCNGKLFANADGIKFYLWLNLRVRTQLVPLPRAKSQIKYLVHRLSVFANTDKDSVRHIDTSVSEDFSGMPDDLQNAYLRGLSEERKKDLLVKTWEKGVIEKCGISYTDMSKHRMNFCQDITNGKSRRALEKRDFIEELDRILLKYSENL